MLPGRRRALHRRSASAAGPLGRRVTARPRPPRARGPARCSPPARGRRRTAPSPPARRASCTACGTASSSPSPGCVSLFVPEVAVYAVPNNGGWYDFGYFLGIVVFGVGAPAQHAQRRHGPTVPRTRAHAPAWRARASCVEGRVITATASRHRAGSPVASSDAAARPLLALALRAADPRLLPEGHGLAAAQYRRRRHRPAADPHPRQQAAARSGSSRDRLGALILARRR